MVTPNAEGKGPEGDALGKEPHALTGEETGHGRKARALGRSQTGGHAGKQREKTKYLLPQICQFTKPFHILI